MTSREELIRQFDNVMMLGFSEVPVGDEHVLGPDFHFQTNVLRGIKQCSSKTGLFRENIETTFWIFDGQGKTVHESKTRCNNMGLVSNRNYHRKDDEYRIVVLGDETAAPSSSNLYWPDFLEDALNGNDAVKGSFGTFRVFNFGHPSTGVSDWADIWTKRCEALDPDLTIVYLPAHVSNRVGPIYPHASHWGKLPGFRYVCYKNPKGREAWTWIRSSGFGTSLREPDSFGSAILCFWMDPKIAKDPEMVLSIRNQFIEDYVAGADEESPEDPFHRRRAAAPVLPTFSDKEKAVWVYQHLDAIRSKSRNTMVVMCPVRADLADKGDVEWVQRLTRADPSLEIQDFRPYLGPLGPTEAKAWFLDQLPEQLTDRGHEVFGGAIARLVAEHLKTEALKGLVTRSVETMERKFETWEERFRALEGRLALLEKK